MRPWWVVFVVLASLATPALADDKAKAAAHYKQGKAFFDAKAFDQAIAEYQQAYALDRVAAHLFNIGLAYELKGDLKNALDAYQKYLAADPAGARVADARRGVATVTQQLDEAAKKQRAIDEAAKKAAADKKAREDQDDATKKLAVIAHVKQAEAYAKAGAWSQAGEEHRAAAAIDEDPQHLLDAADAFAKQPDHAKAREALLAYLAKVPLGANSDQLRTRVAELTRAIEKADADERLRKDELAKLAIVAVPPPAKVRRNSIGVELRSGLYGSGRFVTQSPFSEHDATPGPAFGGGIFIDFPLLTASHVRVGLRARRFKNTFDTAMCPTGVMCPSELSATHAGPAITLEPSLYHRGRLDVYAILGFSFGVALGKPKASFDGAADQELEPRPLAEPELGFGVRFGPVSLDVTLQFGLTNLVGGFNNAIAMDFEFKKSAGVIVAASWTLPR